MGEQFPGTRDGRPFGTFALVDSRTARPQLLALIGQHGSLTAAEQLVPLLIHAR